jgi:hypothetical protein
MESITTPMLAGGLAALVVVILAADFRIRRRAVQLAKFVGLLTAFATYAVFGRRAADWVLRAVFRSESRDQT